MSRRQVVLATRNAHKVQEVQRILAQAALDIEVLDLAGFDPLPPVVESGISFADNAFLKAHSVAQHTGLPAIGDDSGLCVDVMGGAPGIFSARWSGPEATDVANLDLLLAQLADIPDRHRGAHFTCAVAYVEPDGRQLRAEGHVAGRLATKPSGSNGFGYDPIFVPDTGDAAGQSTFAMMSAGAKDALSHRGRALQALAAQLRSDSQTRERG